MEDLFANTTDLVLAQQLNSAFDDILLQHGLRDDHKVKRDEPSFVQTVFQVRN